MLLKKWQNYQILLFALPITLFWGFFCFLAIFVFAPSGTGVSDDGTLFFLGLGFSGLLSIVGGWVFLYFYEELLESFSSLNIKLIFMLFPSILLLAFVLYETRGGLIWLNVILLHSFLYVLHCYYVLLYPLFKRKPKA